MHPALGIDYGEARIGIAATDACGILAHPVESIHLQRTEPLERIATLVKERGIRTLVLGLPLRMDGTEGTACAKVRVFGEKLHTRLPELPLIYVDEYLPPSWRRKNCTRPAKRQRISSPSSTRPLRWKS